MKTSTCTLLGVVLAGVLAGPVQAQHAGFVLLGDPNEDGLNLPAERKAVHPITAPYYHEDSFVTTDVRAWYLHHNFPEDNAIGGGTASVYAVQVRVAITDQIQLVAYKDGYTDFDAGLLEDDGWNDIAAGIKWNFWQDWENDLHAAVGIGYQFGWGDDDVLQQDDELRIWGSVNKGFDKLHLGGTMNFLIPTDGEEALGDSTRLFWHLHADYYVNPWFSPVIELNGFHTIVDGTNKPLPFSGVDVASLGGGQGQDVVTVGVGGEVRPLENLGLRAAFEVPITDNTDIFESRWTFSAVYGF